MPRTIYSPSTMPVQPAPDPLLLYIQQAQLTLLYGAHTSGSDSKSQSEVRVAA